MKERLYHVILSGAKNPMPATDQVCPVILSGAKNPMPATDQVCPVILSGAKNPMLATDHDGSLEILRSAQNDMFGPVVYGARREA